MDVVVVVYLFTGSLIVDNKTVFLIYIYWDVFELYGSLYWKFPSAVFHSLISFIYSADSERTS